MSVLSSYTRSAKNPVEPAQGVQESVSEIQETEASIQVRHNWKQSTVTQQIVKQTIEEMDTLLAMTISLAVTYPTHSNHQQIVQNLVKINTLKEFLDKHIYGK